MPLCDCGLSAFARLARGIRRRRKGCSGFSNRFASNRGGVMYRQRRRRLHRRRRATVAAVSVAVLAIAVGVPTIASANPVNDLLNNLGLGGGGATDGGGATATPDAGSPPTYTPPLHGTEPHGQGSDAVVDLAPSTSNPYPADPTQQSGGEELIAGDSRGQQSSDGTYHGRATLLYLLGTPIIQVTSDPG